MATAAEVQAEGPAPPPPRTGEAAAAAEATEPPATPEKRSAPAEREEEEKGEEPRPEPKRRRARVAALESVPRAAEVAAAAVRASREDESGSADGCDGGGSFSFHARSFSGAQTTPKFGSFNPAAAADLLAFHLKAPRRPADAAAAEEAEDGAAAAGDEEAAAEGCDGNSR